MIKTPESVAEYLVSIFRSKDNKTPWEAKCCALATAKHTLDTLEDLYDDCISSCNYGHRMTMRPFYEQVITAIIEMP